MKLGPELVAIGVLALVACSPRASAPRIEEPKPVDAVRTLSSEKKTDPDRERRVAEFLAPGRGETAAQGSLPPGLDQPMSKESAVLVHRCDLQRLKILESARARKLKENDATAQLRAKELRQFDPRCADLQKERDVRELDTVRDVAVQQRIVLLAEAIAQAPATCRVGEDNPPRPKPPSSTAPGPLRWDVTGWSCIYAHVPERTRNLLDANVDGSHFSFAIDAELGTYEVVASLRYRGADKQDAWTELVIRGRLGEKPQPTQFFRRAAVTD